MSTFHFNSIISRNPEVTYTLIDSDLVMIGPNDEQFYGVNDTGTVIWTLLESRPMTFSEICASIQQDYEVTEAVCIEDATQFIQAMIAQNMLSVLE